VRCRGELKKAYTRAKARILAGPENATAEALAYLEARQERKRPWLT
jgi:hypothetical protein